MDTQTVEELDKLYKQLLKARRILDDVEYNYLILLKKLKEK